MLETLWEIAKELGLTPTTAGLYAVVYLMGAKMELWPKPRWMNGRKNGNGELGAKMDTLAAHFNDETSATLTEMRKNQQEIMQGQRDICNKLSNIEKYGVKIRK